VDVVIRIAIAEQIAKQRNIHIAESDIDKKLTLEREPVAGKNASDADWDPMFRVYHHERARVSEIALTPDLLSQAVEQSL